MALLSRRGGCHDHRVIDDDIRVRRVRPDDAPELERLYADLGGSSRSLRFHHRAHAVSHREAAAFATVDHQRREGFVAVHGSQVVGHLAMEPRGGGVDELAVVVDDRTHGHGVGTLLLAAALASARLRGISWLVAWVAAENGVARHLLEGTQRRTRRFWEGSVARYEIDVPPLPQSWRDRAQTI
jgi:GNAT superfamily N-acetyltransferase